MELFDFTMRKAKQAVEEGQAFSSAAFQAWVLLGLEHGGLLF